MVATVTTHDAILKTLVPDIKLIRMIEEDEPFYGLCKKRTDFDGKKKQVPVRSNNNQAISPSFSVAQAITAGATNIEFDITRTECFGFATLANELIEASKSKKGAFVDAVEDEVKSTMETLMGYLGVLLYGNGGGAIGQISDVTTTRITLTDPRDSVNFHKGMVLQSSLTDGTSGAVKAGSHTVSAVDEENGYIDAATNWSTGIATIANSDYLFRSGGFGSVIAGLGAWCPSTAPTTGDSYFGADRSVNATRLAGTRYTSTATTTEDAIQDALGYASQHRVGKLTHGFLNAQRWHELAKEMGSRVVRDDSVKSRATGFGYESLAVIGPKGVTRLLPSIYCPYNTAFFTCPENWYLDGLGPMPQMFKYDGKYMHLVPTADQRQIRFGWKGNLWTPYPHNLVRLTFS